MAGQMRIAWNQKLLRLHMKSKCQEGAKGPVYDVYDQAHLTLSLPIPTFYAQIVLHRIAGIDTAVARALRSFRVSFKLTVQKGCNAS